MRSRKVVNGEIWEIVWNSRRKCDETRVRRQGRAKVRGDVTAERCGVKMREERGERGGEMARGEVSDPRG